MTNHSCEDLKSMWQGQPTQPTQVPVTELRRKAQRLQRAVQWRNVREYVGGTLAAAAFGYYLWKFDTPLVRAGSVLSIVGALFVMYRIRKRGSGRRVPAEMARHSCVDFYRKELERQRDLLRGVFLWCLVPFIPGLGLFLLGLGREQLGGRYLPVAVVGVICTIVFLVVAQLNRWAARHLQRQIDALDELGKES